MKQYVKYFKSLTEFNIWKTLETKNAHIDCMTVFHDELIVIYRNN